MTMPAMLGVVKTILQAHSLSRRVVVIETKEFSPEQFLFKLRVDLPRDFKLQVRIYHNHDHTDYAYQLFTSAPILRWDNKEEFRHLDTFPHHHHDEYGNVVASPLTGDPVHDLGVVMQRVEEFLAGRDGE